MERFSLSDCEILWRKEMTVPEKDKAAVVLDLIRLSDFIHETMIFTKTWALSKDREIVLRVWLNVESEDDYYVDIWYEEGVDGWCLDIKSGGQLIGEVVSEKWKLVRIVREGGIE